MLAKLVLSLRDLLLFYMEKIMNQLNDLEMDLLAQEQIRDLRLFVGKEKVLENLNCSNASNKKLRAFMALFENSDSI
jgi:hypothetical protein